MTGIAKPPRAAMFSAIPLDVGSVPYSIAKAGAIAPSANPIVVKGRRSGVKPVRKKRAPARP